MHRKDDVPCDEVMYVIALKSMIALSVKCLIDRLSVYFG